MRQVIFRIPIPGTADGLPIYGYGLMLFVAFIVCTWLAGRRAQKEGIAKEHIQDLAIWLFVGGLLVARFTYLIKYSPYPLFSWDFLSQFPRIWDGGVILYGAVIGGMIGYALAHHFIIRKHHLSGWKIADIAAPSVALGIALGRIGCLLNGCCYGHVACPHCPGVSFPLSAPPRYELVQAGDW
jgi:prolipoprotein diacylglyceryl transferase